MPSERVRVTLNTPGEPSGLALMLAQYVEQNLRDCPEKSDQAERLRGTVALQATEGDVGVTLRFAGNEIEITDGCVPAADLFVRGGIFSLTDLAAGAGGAVRRLGRGDLTVRAVWKHPLFTLRVARFMRVPGRLPAGPSVAWKVAAATGVALVLAALATYLVST